MVEQDEAKIFKTLMDGVDALYIKVSVLQLLVIILMGINIVTLLKLLYP